MPPTKTRPDPIIPDHEVLRKIGGGAYGEVWLARGVTGALRAVKVVWREDFDDARGFEREFEGILKFEPMSRDHPGLVNVLHVGRSPDGISFYYYVMELGDDVRTGSEINAVEYEPRTLRSDSKMADGTRLDTALCIDVGLRLAEALDHLHERGLAHRDVKPANVIFVNGKAKLADIGLVATRDQRTFVGTEGFVPPEGPGSAQADVYSLGKVLYEIATGKDRLDFPELPDELPPPEERKRWLELNRIICDICDPQLSRRKISTAGELADSLRRLQRGKRRRRTGLAAWMTTLVLGGFVVFGSWEIFKDGPWAQLLASTEPEPVSAEPEPQMGLVKVLGYPEGAEVIGAQGQWLGVTPLTLKVLVGSNVEYTIRMEGFKPEPVRGTVPKSAVNEAYTLNAGSLLSFKPPEIGSIWENERIKYNPVGDEHLSSTFVVEGAWNEFLRKEPEPPKGPAEFLAFSQNGKQDKIALVKPEDAPAYCNWLRKSAIAGGRLSEDHEMIAKFDEGFNDPGLSETARAQNLKPFRVLVRLIPYGSILVVSDPPGAGIMLDEGRMIEQTTPVLIPKIKPGRVIIRFSLDGYKSEHSTVDLKPGENRTVEQALTENQGVRFDRPWRNGLGMRFVPFGADKDLMVSIWETRISDYEAFKQDKDSGARNHRMPDEKNKDHPMTYVNRDDAVKFCAWLTKRERRDSRITVTSVYRLPTDLEWSRLAGLWEPADRSPATLDTLKKPIYQWGGSWPPPQRFANLADISAARAPGMSADRTIPGYEDGFKTSAPVGSFAPNSVGLYDLCGNVHEWVQDNYKSDAPPQGHAPMGVVRGGGWNSFRQEDLYIGYRNTVPANMADSIYGFRVVLVKEPIKEENSNVTEPVPKNG